jgi:malonyl-CoA O-methyltransferase
MKLNKEICNAFNKHAAGYQEAAIVQREIGERLFERLDYLKIQPKYVLDLGCGSGYFSKKLKSRYPQALVVGLDLAINMLSQAKASQSWLKRWPLVHASMTNMPFPTGLFDLVFTNQAIHWAGSMGLAMREINRVMNKDGCFMFSTLGPDTFLELRTAWASADPYAHVNEFVDMHDLGDVMLSEHFIDPVVDMEMLHVHYETLPKLVRSLKAQGVRNINSARNKGLTGKQSWHVFEEAMTLFCTEKGHYPLRYEVVYGHAWKGATTQRASGSETFIPVSQLRQTGF